MDSNQKRALEQLLKWEFALIDQSWKVFETWSAPTMQNYVSLLLSKKRQYTAKSRFPLQTGNFFCGSFAGSVKPV